MIRIFLLSLTAGLAGCELPPLPAFPVMPSAYHSVSYYDAHPLERDQANAWCHDNPGLASRYPSCGSADESGNRAFNRKMGWR